MPLNTVQLSIMSNGTPANHSVKDSDALKKLGTRVFKKSSPNGKITAYLGKRDFIDVGAHVDPVDGVVLVDEDYIRDRKVFVQVLAAFRYGREDLDVLGLTFRKDLFLSTVQVYPPVPAARSPTWLQERLVKKLGDNAYPFYFELSHDTPASVTLQPGPGDSGKPCGIDYELKAFVGDDPEDKPHKRNSVRLAIRKLTYAPEVSGPQPSAEVVKEFIMSPGTLRVEATLDKEKYYHGESLGVNILVDNNTTKTVKKIKISVRQLADINLFTSNHYKCIVGDCESEEGFPIYPSQTGWCKVYHVCPLLSNNREKRGLALDGKLKHEDTNLASSTIFNTAQQKENLGIIVQYKVRIRLVLGFGTSDVCLELPVILTHPKPIDDTPPAPSRDTGASMAPSQPSTVVVKTTPTQSPCKMTEKPPVLDTNLIFLEGVNGDSGRGGEGSQKGDHHLNNYSPESIEDPNVTEDDLIFESFARLRLNGDENVGEMGC